MELNRELVLAKAVRVLGAGRLAEVLAVLDGYGGAERERVQLGVLRLWEVTGVAGEGDGEKMVRLHGLVEAARRDYRDVLLGAEYERAGALPPDAVRTDGAAYKAARKADRAAYAAWLRGGA